MQIVPEKIYDYKTNIAKTLDDITSQTVKSTMQKGLESEHNKQKEQLNYKEQKKKKKELTLGKIKHDRIQ